MSSWTQASAQRASSRGELEGKGEDSPLQNTGFDRTPKLLLIVDTPDQHQRVPAHDARLF